MTTGVLTTGAGPILIGVTAAGAGVALAGIIHGDGTVGTDGTTGAGVALVGTTGAGVALAGITGAGAVPLPGTMDGDGTTMVGEVIMETLIMDSTDMDVVTIITVTTIPEGAIITEIL